MIGTYSRGSIYQIPGTVWNRDPAERRYSIRYLHICITIFVTKLLRNSVTDFQLLYMYYKSVRGLLVNHWAIKVTFTYILFLWIFFRIIGELFDIITANMNYGPCGNLSILSYEYLFHTRDVKDYPFNQLYLYFYTVVLFLSFYNTGLKNSFSTGFLNLFLSYITCSRSYNKLVFFNKIFSRNDLCGKITCIG